MTMDTANIRKAYDVSIKLLCKKLGFRGRMDGMSELKMICPTIAIRIHEAERDIQDLSEKYFIYKRHIDKAMELWREGLSKIKARRKKI